MLSLFAPKMATPPLLIASSGKDILIFHFSVLPLFLEDAERYVTEHVQCMYPLLPTMRGANQQLIKQAIDELVTLYRDDEVTLAQQIIWMELLLERTTTVSKKEKQKVREVLSMYDSLWEENPKVRQIKAKAAEEGHRQGLNEGLKEGLNEGRKEGLNEGRKEGLTEGFTKGRVESSQELVMKIVRRRFPRLVEPAMQRIAQIRSYEALDMLMDQLLDAPDETTARIVLRLPVA